MMTGETDIYKITNILRQIGFVLILISYTQKNFSNVSFAMHP